MVDGEYFNGEYSLFTIKIFTIHYYQNVDY